MWNIIKSIRYSLRREITTYMFFIITILLLALFVYDTFGGVKLSEILEMTGSEAFISLMDVGAVVGIIVMSVAIIPNVFAGDFSGKYINYEILSGHKRDCQIMARVILSAVYMGLYYLVMIIVPIAFFTVLNGWGYSLPLKIALRQVVLLILVSARLFTVIAFISYALKNSLYSLVAFFTDMVLLLPIMLLSPNPESIEPTWLGLTNSLYGLLALTSTTNTYFGFEEGKDVVMSEFTYANELIPALFAVPVMITVFGILAMIAINSKRDY